MKSIILSTFPFLARLFCLFGPRFTSGTVLPRSGILISRMDNLNEIDDSDMETITYTGDWTHSSNATNDFMMTESFSNDACASVMAP